MSKITLVIDDIKQYLALKKAGWVIKEEIVSYNQNVYHNQVETIEFTALIVYSPDGTGKLNYSWGMFDNKFSQVNQIFAEVLSEKLIGLVEEKEFQGAGDEG